MNKEIYKVLEHIIPHPKVSRIAIYTNAMGAYKGKNTLAYYEMKNRFFHNQLRRPSGNSPKIIAEIDALGIAYRESPPINWTDSGTIFEGTG